MTHNFQMNQPFIKDYTLAELLACFLRHISLLLLSLLLGFGVGYSFFVATETVSFFSKAVIASTNGVETSETISNMAFSVKTNQALFSFSDSLSKDGVFHENGDSITYSDLYSSLSVSYSSDSESSYLYFTYSCSESSISTVAVNKLVTYAVDLLNPMFSSTNNPVAVLSFAKESVKSVAKNKSFIPAFVFSFFVVGCAVALILDRNDDRVYNPSSLRVENLPFLHCYLRSKRKSSLFILKDFFKRFCPQESISLCCYSGTEQHLLDFLDQAKKSGGYGDDSLIFAVVQIDRSLNCDSEINVSSFREDQKYMLSFRDSMIASHYLSRLFGSNKFTNNRVFLLLKPEDYLSMHNQVCRFCNSVFFVADFGETKMDDIAIFRQIFLELPNQAKCSIFLDRKRGPKDLYVFSIVASKKRHKT